MPPHPEDAPCDPISGLPPGWYQRRINKRTYVLCEVCGNIKHFKGGISTYLQEYLGLSPQAQCEFDEATGSGLHRTRFKRSRTG